MEKRKLKILAIEDDPNYFILLREHLARVQDPVFELIGCELMQSGLDRLQQGDIDLVLLDLTLPDSQGLDQS